MNNKKKKISWKPLTGRARQRYLFVAAVFETTQQIHYCAVHEGSWKVVLMADGHSWSSCHIRLI